MSNDKAPSHWIRMRSSLTSDIIQAASVEQFKHPAEAMETFDDEQSTVDQAKEMFVRLLMHCLPNQSRGGAGGGNEDRKMVGYRRMCVMAYVCAPALFNGMTKRELAKHIGITPRALRYEIKTVKALMITNNK